MDKHNTFSTKTEETKIRAVPERMIWARFYNYIKPYSKNLIVGSISIVGGALTGLVAPYLHMIAINNIITPAASTGDTSYLSAFKWWIPVFLLVTGANYGSDNKRC
jgi:ABC-type multidrug transport system fused ATPase/permease subunit